VAGRRFRRRAAFSFIFSMLRQILIYLAAGLGWAAGVSAQTLQVAGSDLLQVAVGEPLAKYAQKAGLDLKVDFSGTIPAMTQLQDDKVQLAIIAAPVGQQPSAKDLVVLTYAYQVAYVLVNPDNPITEVDRDELMGVFGTVETDVTTWSQMGLAGEWSDRPVLAVCTSNDDGVVQELFKHVILGGTPLKPGVTILKSGVDLPKMITDNPNIIAIGRYAPDQSKALYVSFERSTSTTLPGAAGDSTGDGTGGDAGVVPGGSKASFAPTEDNVYNGDYPLRLPFYIVYKPANKEKVRQLLQVLYGEEFTAHLLDQHFMPLPDTERKRTLLELDKAK